MIFTDDTEEGLRAAVWLVNSAEDPDTLTDLAEERAFLEEFPYTGRLDRDETELASLRDLRPHLRAMLLAPRDEMAAHVNRALAAAHLSPHLVRHGDMDWHLHAVEDERPFATRIVVETAMAMIDVIRADEMSRLGVCADDECGGLVLDLSRNRSRRFCSTACGNRAAVAAYRARQSG